MPEFPRDVIEPKLNDIEAKYKEGLQDLRKLIPIGGRVLNLGCAIGSETMALMWFLEAGEVIGVDKKHTLIFNAKQDIKQFKLDLENCQLSVDNKLVSPNNCEWWCNLPPFLHEKRFPTFEEMDIVLEREFKSKLGQELYHLVYCSSVLDKIHECHGRDGVLSAIGRIYDILVPGGWFVANEPCWKDLSYFEKEMTEAGFEVTVLCKNMRPEFRCNRPK